MNNLVILLTCKRCSVRFNLSAVDKDLGLLNGKLPCPTTGCSGLLKRTETAVITKARVISAVGLFSALGGAGLPEERAAAIPTHIKSNFVGAKVKSISMDSISGRTIIKSMTFSNNRVMHFAVSTKGAIVFKVTEDVNGSR